MTLLVKFDATHSKHLMKAILYVIYRMNVEYIVLYLYIVK